MKYLLMLGPAIDSPGGMSSVVATYRHAGLFERWPLQYVATYRHPNRLSKIGCLLQSLATVLFLLLTRQVALLHVHTASRGGYWRKSLFVLLARLFGAPVILHIHSGEFMHWYDKECGDWRRAYVRWILRLSRRVVCLTPAWQTNLKGIEPSIQTSVLGNPVEQFDAVREQRSTGSVEAGLLLFLGRIREKKGVYDLVRAMPAVLAAVPGARLLLAGDGELAQVQSFAAELGVAHAIECPGWVGSEKKCELLARCEGFVLPSHAEGLPVCILEAMASGVPVASTAVGGIPEVLQNGRLGLLVPPGDVSLLAAALIKLLTDSALRADLSAAALQHVLATYDVDRVVENLEAIYKSILVEEKEKMEKRR